MALSGYVRLSSQYTTHAVSRNHGWRRSCLGQLVSLRFWQETTFHRYFWISHRGLRNTEWSTPQRKVDFRYKVQTNLKPLHLSFPINDRAIYVALEFQWFDRNAQHWPCPETLHTDTHTGKLFRLNSLSKPSLRHLIKSAANTESLNIPRTINQPMSRDSWLV
jgi:hypothetical protein